MRLLHSPSQFKKSKQQFCLRTHTHEKKKVLRALRDLPSIETSSSKLELSPSLHYSVHPLLEKLEMRALKALENYHQKMKRTITLKNKNKASGESENHRT